MPIIPTTRNRVSVPNENAKDLTRVFEKFGVRFDTGKVEALADECPWCGKDRFHVNRATGQYHCKKCGEKGNVTTYLTWLHGETLSVTTDEQFRQLKEKRGIPLQTLKRHALAYDTAGQRWLIPFRNAKGSVVNIQLYHPDRPKPNKFNLPGLATCIYGLDRLSSDKEKILFLCEGPFDAIALDYHLGMKRGKYDILATPGTFQEKWQEHFRGRKVRALYDNDKGGEQHRERVRKLLGESGVAAELRLLYWPEGFPAGCDINDLVRDRPDIPLVGWTLEHSTKVVRDAKLIIVTYEDRERAKPIDWVWPDHIRCGTYVSLSGEQATMKSTIALDIIARYTTGKPMPAAEKASMPAGNVLYITAEDEPEEVWTRLDTAGADCKCVQIMRAVVKGGDSLNVLDHLGEIEERIREQSIRLVVIDGQNSVVGAPDISTDMKGRYNVTNKLHQFAQRLNICLIGIRNEDREGRAMGSQSMGDVARCVLRTERVSDSPTEQYFRLIFKKVSDAAPKTHPPIPYSVKDLGGNRRRILWGKEKPEKVLANDLARKSIPKKPYPAKNYT